MDHQPFIIGAYVATGLVLGWCALAPVIRGMRLRRELRAVFEVHGDQNAPDA
jgi:heme exporter protein CcmD